MPRHIQVICIGDSTVKNGAGDGANGQWGWGDWLAGFFDSGRVTVINRARGGRSSRTFFTGGDWEAALAMAGSGDFVLIQFGHNDASPVNDDSRARGTLKGTGDETEEIDNLLTGRRETVHTFGWYLRQYVRGTFLKGATPVLLSPVPRNEFENGRLKRAAADYGLWARQLAQEEGAPFIDLNELAAAELEKIALAIGEAKTGEEYFCGDNTHSSLAGARLNAAMVARGIQTSELDVLEPV